MLSKEEQKLKNILERQKKDKLLIKELKKKVKLQQEEEKLKRWQKIGEIIERETKKIYTDESEILELIKIHSGEKM